MSFNYDASNVAEDKGGRFSLLPPGWYEMKITEATEKKSSKGNDMVALKCAVTEPFEYAGKWLFHNVTFLPPERKGANMALHFLKVIKEPHQGAFDVDGRSWVGKRFRGKVVQGEYEGKARNEIKEVSPVDAENKDDDSIPF